MRILVVLVVHTCVVSKVGWRKGRHHGRVAPYGLEPAATASVTVAFATVVGVSMGCSIVNTYCPVLRACRCVHVTGCCECSSLNVCTTMPGAWIQGIIGARRPRYRCASLSISESV